MGKKDQESTKCFEFAEKAHSGEEGFVPEDEIFPEDDHTQDWSYSAANNRSLFTFFW